MPLEFPRKATWLFVTHLVSQLFDARGGVSKHILLLFQAGLMDVSGEGFSGSFLEKMLEAPSAQAEARGEILYRERLVELALDDGQSGFDSAIHVA
jgi:hypothetical protein